MIDTKVISDSTFYICFLDDISYPEGLKKIICSGKFKFVIGPIVMSEIEKSPNYHFIKPDLSKVQENPLPFNYGEIVRPFLGIEEIKKGEHEVIGIAIVYYLMGREFILILDEDGPREIIEKKIIRSKIKNDRDNWIYKIMLLSIRNIHSGRSNKYFREN